MYIIANLPAWRKICRKCKLKERMIPCDVRTRWNSTYDMLYFSQNYRPAIHAITSEKSCKLRKYELDETEWEIIGDLVSTSPQLQAGVFPHQQIQQDCNFNDRDEASHPIQHLSRARRRESTRI
ncbi:hypothetical protein B0H11DRAFT_1702958 [Mycena galericulata]|nr:hypothetical protein B0H11DRAFT_1755778 [Mycena galericulata]KAJ7509360.1 hypothetical protein B0H11DRAFT_1702958 [Mycena galericulata]